MYNRRRIHLGKLFISRESRFTWLIGHYTSQNKLSCQAETQPLKRRGGGGREFHETSVKGFLTFGKFLSFYFLDI